MAKKVSKNRVSWKKIVDEGLRDLKSVLDKLREYDLKHGT